MEKHLRSLESLGEDVNNNMIVSLAKSKLPRFVIARLEKYKDDDSKPWDLNTLRKGLNKFVSAQEAGERQMNLHTTQYSGEDNSSGFPNRNGRRKPLNPRYTTGALPTVIKRACIFCAEDHWNDECKS